MTTSLQIGNPMVLSFVFGRLAFFCWSRPCGPMSRGNSPIVPAVWLWFLSFLSLLFLPVAQPQIKTHSNFPVVAPLSAVLNFLHA